MQITVEIPDEYANLVLPEGSDPARLLLEHAVAQAYRERRISTYQVRQLLGIEYRIDVDPFLLKYEIYDYTIEDLQSDLANMERSFAAEREKSAA